MPALTDVDRRFRLLQDEVIHTYEEKLKRDREMRHHSVKRLQRREEEVREIIRASQLDLDRLDHMVQEDEAASLDFLREVRPSLIQRPALGAEDAKNFSFSSGLQISNRSLSTVYAATLLASDSANLEGNPGEKGNPWVLPWNPGRVNIKGSETGNGSGCLAQPSVPGTDASAVFWFAFIPDRTAIWNLDAVVNLHGFYILRANDTFFTCKDSLARVVANMDVYQYYWNGEKHFSLVNIEQDNINEAVLYDNRGVFDYRLGLREGDYAFVKVTISLHTFAKGGGAYSEVNFSDGSGNYIEPVGVYMW